MLVERSAFTPLGGRLSLRGLINPRSVRRFTEAMGALEKTDRIDAGVIAHCAITMDVKPTASPSSSQQRLTAFVARLPQLTDDLTVQ